MLCLFSAGEETVVHVHLQFVRVGFLNVRADTL